MTTSPNPKLLSKGRTGFDAGAAVLRQHLKTVPDQPGVYRMMNEKAEVLYVGKAKNLKKRVSSYTQRARLPNRLQRMVAQIRNLEIVTTRTEAEALLLEANFIQRLAPPFNVLLRDDKSYPYILITREHDFPQLLKHRGAHNRKGWYFGPFASGAAVTETLTLLQRAFQLRNCSDSYFAARTRPCLQYHIKRCTAPCTNKISVEDYARQAEEARDFLKGKNLDVQQKLAADMQRASDAMDYEYAATLRDRIKILTGIQARQDINVAGLGDADIIALHQQAGKTGVQVFFFRSDRNYGARVFYPTHDRDTPVPQILAAFLAQFYAGKPAPPLLLLNHRPDDAALLEQALTESAGHKVILAVPKAGARKRLVDHAAQNAEEALARHLSGRMEQAKLLDRVADLFGLSEAPKRIEVYDNSHISGSHAVGGMIAAGPEGFLKKTYRKFNIRSAQTNDDFAMMEEVLTRRFSRLVEEDPQRTSGLWPDLVLIDGGAGQLGKVKAVLQNLGIATKARLPLAGAGGGLPPRDEDLEHFSIKRDPNTGVMPAQAGIHLFETKTDSRQSLRDFGNDANSRRSVHALDASEIASASDADLPTVTLVGIAKGPDRNAGRERFFIEGREPFSLPQDDPALYYLQRLRDEAHRFAIGTHRAIRTKAIGISGLEEIQGIGATRKRALLHHFGSAKAVAGAGLEELSRTPGISPSIAKKIHDYFRERG